MNNDIVFNSMIGHFNVSFIIILKCTLIFMTKDIESCLDFLPVFDK